MLFRRQSKCQFKNKLKHIDINCHNVGSKVAEKTIRVEYQSSSIHRTDHFTKDSINVAFECFRSRIGFVTANQLSSSRKDVSMNIMWTKLVINWTHHREIQQTFLESLWHPATNSIHESKNDDIALLFSPDRQRKFEFVFWEHVCTFSPSFFWLRPKKRFWQLRSTHNRKQMTFNVIEVQRSKFSNTQMKQSILINNSDANK